MKKVYIILLILLGIILMGSGFNVLINYGYGGFFIFLKKTLKGVLDFFIFPVKKFESLSSSQKIAVLFLLVFVTILVCTIIKNKQENNSMKYTWFIISLVAVVLLLSLLCFFYDGVKKYFLPIFFIILFITCCIMIGLSFLKKNKNTGYSIKLYQPILTTFTSYNKFIFWFLLIFVGIYFILYLPKMFVVFFDEFNKADFSSIESQNSNLYMY